MHNRRNPILSGLIVVLIIVVGYLLTNQNRTGTLSKKDSPEYTSSLNRDPNRLVFSKHARCRMACRLIDSFEVVDILENGSVNYRKSDTTGSRDPKFALEGRTHDGQQVRIVFAMAESKTVVVTVIDLGQDIECSCP